MVTLKIKDETGTGKLINEWNLLLKAEMITVRELITQRVKAEVETYNKTKEEFFNGLVQPTESEKCLNGYKMRERKAINIEVQINKALEAFESNGFFIIANDRQLDTLDEHLLIDDEICLIFIKLINLIGG
jgi:hypothetical protein